MRNVRKTINRYEIPVHPDTKISIYRGYIPTGPMGDVTAGFTTPDGSIKLTQRAFRNEEDLARTIFHENFHLGQARRDGFTPAVGTPEHRAREVEASRADSDWWKNHPLNRKQTEGTS
jgi:hypothetical protein